MQDALAHAAARARRPAALLAYDGFKRIWRKTALAQTRARRYPVGALCS